MDQNYNDEQQRYLMQQAAQNQGMASQLPPGPSLPPMPVQPAPNNNMWGWMKVHWVWTLIIIIVIILLIWYFCFKNKSKTAQVTVTPRGGIPKTATVNVKTVRGMY